MKQLRAFVNDQTGQVLVITALCMVVLLGFVGFAIDVGHLRLVKSQMQSAADATALAAGLEIRVCSATAGCPAMQSAVQAAMTENGMAGALFLTNCSSAVGSGISVILNDPPCASSSDPNRGSTKYVEAVVTQNVTTYFSRVFGFNNIRVSARAEAKRGVGPCIYALDPHAAGAITVLAGVGIKSTCGVVDESDSANALACTIGLATAPRIAITGGINGLLLPSLLGPLLCGASPGPVTQVPVPAVPDPLSYLSPPPHASDKCPANATGTNFTGSGNAINITALSIVLQGTNYTFNPGLYCGGINITAAALLNITFNPGVYILRDGKGLLGTQGGFNLTLPLLSNIRGQGVMFYNQGQSTAPAASVGGFSITSPITAGKLLPLNGLNFSAQTSGDYGGILFFQAHGVTTSGTYLANVAQGSNFEGAIYEPDAKVAYAVGALSSNYNILVAKQINFTAQVLSTFGSNYAALANGSPLQSDVAVLVQ